MSKLLDFHHSHMDYEPIHDYYHETILRFYDTGLSWSAAESMAKLWARAYIDSQGQDHDAANVARRLSLSPKEAYAILGQYEDFKNSFNQYQNL